MNLISEDGLVALENGQYGKTHTRGSLFVSVIGRLDNQQWSWPDHTWLEETHVFYPRHNFNPIVMAI